MPVGGKHRRTLNAIFAEPTRSNVAWRHVEALLAALGAELTEGRGSRVRVRLNGVRAVFHRPHPQSELHKSALARCGASSRRRESKRRSSGRC